jgi:hypothetical protein
MKIVKSQLKKMIMEMLDAEHPADVEPVEDVWSGDIELKDRNLAHFIDHPKAYGGDETTREPEMLPRQEDLVAETSMRSSPWTLRQGATGYFQLKKNGKPVKLWGPAGPMAYNDLDKIKHYLDKKGVDPESVEGWPRLEPMTESRLRAAIRNIILTEEAADCESDYRAGGLSWEEYQDCLERFSEEEYYSPGSKAKKDPYGWGDRGRGYGRRRRSYYR